ncbi:hypothetical protein BJ508DRAFT_309640 [Ascobolus immersus RN42]|uniref:Uncharacterized protein n=1 Tax=Ascobolus immersus RN42 TaxID=1160509 RepID=A0A3N4HW50_ASCIM|nr:hypothetical protein BJ508DRAFT_309640 [Ascobolus immersus RN42]
MADHDQQQYEQDEHYPDESDVEIVDATDADPYEDASSNTLSHDQMSLDEEYEEDDGLDAYFEEPDGSDDLQAEHGPRVGVDDGGPPHLFVFAEDYEQDAIEKDDVNFSNAGLDPFGSDRQFSQDMSPVKNSSQTNNSNTADVDAQQTDGGSDEDGDDDEEPDAPVSKRSQKQKKKDKFKSVPKVTSTFTKDDDHEKGKKPPSLATFLSWTDRQQLNYECGISPDNPRREELVRELRRELVLTAATLKAIKLNQKNLNSYSTLDRYRIVATLELRFQQLWNMEPDLVSRILKAYLEDTWHYTKRKLRKQERREAAARAERAQQQGAKKPAPSVQPKKTGQAKPVPEPQSDGEDEQDGGAGHGGVESADDTGSHDESDPFEPQQEDEEAVMAARQQKINKLQSMKKKSVSDVITANAIALNKKKQLSKQAREDDDALNEQITGKKTIGKKVTAPPKQQQQPPQPKLKTAMKKAAAQPAQPPPAPAPKPKPSFRLPAPKMAPLEDSHHRLQAAIAAQKPGPRPPTPFPKKNHVKQNPILPVGHPEREEKMTMLRGDIMKVMKKNGLVPDKKQQQQQQQQAAVRQMNTGHARPTTAVAQLKAAAQQDPPSSPPLPVLRMAPVFPVASPVTTKAPAAVGRQLPWNQPALTKSSSVSSSGNDDRFSFQIRGGPLLKMRRVKNFQMLILKLEDHADQFADFDFATDILMFSVDGKKPIALSDGDSLDRLYEAGSGGKPIEIYSAMAFNEFNSEDGPLPSEDDVIHVKAPVKIAPVAKKVAIPANNNNASKSKHISLFTPTPEKAHGQTPKVQVPASSSSHQSRTSILRKSSSFSITPPKRSDGADMSSSQQSRKRKASVEASDIATPQDNRQAKVAKLNAVSQEHDQKQAKVQKPAIALKKSSGNNKKHSTSVTPGRSPVVIPDIPVITDPFNGKPSPGSLQSRAQNNGELMSNAGKSSDFENAFADRKEPSRKEPSRHLDFKETARPRQLRQHQLSAITKSGQSSTMANMAEKRKFSSELNNSPTPRPRKQRKQQQEKPHGEDKHRVLPPRRATGQVVYTEPDNRKRIESKEVADLDKLKEAKAIAKAKENCAIKKFIEKRDAKGAV